MSKFGIIGGLMRSERLLSRLEDFEEVTVKGKEGLGKGSFASVKLVRAKTDGQLYALKEVLVTHPDRACSKQ